MPAAIAVPIGLAIAGMVDTNIQNKAAAQQNTNQQNASVSNARAAWQQAQQNLQSYMSANPAPFSGANIVRPGAYGAAASGSPAMQPSQAPQIQRVPLSQPAQPGSSPATPPINPMVMRMLLARLAQARGAA